MLDETAGMSEITQAEYKEGKEKRPKEGTFKSGYGEDQWRWREMKVGFVASYL